MADMADPRRNEGGGEPEDKEHAGDGDSGFELGSREHQLATDYLLGAMLPIQRRAFEDRLVNDPDVRSRFARFKLWWKRTEPHEPDEAGRFLAAGNARGTLSAVEQLVLKQRIAEDSDFATYVVAAKHGIQLGCATPIALGSTVRFPGTLEPYYRDLAESFAELWGQWEHHALSLLEKARANFPPEERFIDDLLDEARYHVWLHWRRPGQERTPEAFWKEFCDTVAWVGQDGPPDSHSALGDEIEEALEDDDQLPPLPNLDG